MLDFGYKTCWIEEKDESGYNSSGSSPLPGYLGSSPYSVGSSSPHLPLNLEFIQFNPPPQIRILQRPQQKQTQIPTLSTSRFSTAQSNSAHHTSSSNHVAKILLNSALPLLSNPEIKTGPYSTSPNSSNLLTKTRQNSAHYSSSNHKTPWLNSAHEHTSNPGTKTGPYFTPLPSSNQETKIWSSPADPIYSNHEYPERFSNYDNLKKSLNQYSCSNEFYTPEMVDILVLALACDIVRYNYQSTVNTVVL